MSPRLLLPALLAVCTAASAHGLALRGPVGMSGGRLPHLQVNDGFGCNGANRSPALRWVRVPKATRSLAITMFDPDAPTASGWWHWVAYDIPADATGVAAGAAAVDSAALPAGARQARNDFGQRGYGGACPPRGDKPHRYLITLHALDVASLGAPEEASAAQVSDLIRRHRIARSTITATYAR